MYIFYETAAETSRRNFLQSIIIKLSMGGGASTAKIEPKTVGVEREKQIKQSVKYKVPIATDSQDKNSDKTEKRTINDGNIAFTNDSPDAKIANNKLKRLVS